MKRKGLILGAVVAGAALFAGGALSQQQTTIAIATGGTGGVYYPLGGGMHLARALPGDDLHLGLGSDVLRQVLIGHKDHLVDTEALDNL